MKKLRHKLICTAFLAVSGVFVIVLVILYVSYGLYYSRQADAMTQLISGNGGIVPEFQEYKNRNDQEDSLYPIILNEESEFRTRYFIVYLGEDAQTVSLNIEHIASVSESEASEMAETVISGDKTTGYLDSYRYRVTQNDNTYTVIFLDCSENFTSRTVTMRIIALTAILIIVLITFLFGLFSKRVVQPFEENANRQKQFITDASHELKTPLSIISANAEVLEYKNGKNDWTQNIIAQSQRMGKLIGDLLTLSQMDEVEAEAPKKPVNFSQIAAETASSFQEVADQKHVTLQLAIAEDLTVKGNTEQLRQMVSVLTENASKYVTADGTIRVSLERAGKYAVLRVYNTAQLEENLDCSRLFDRFYRPDSSRSSETGGHGIGLSIAKKIAVQHGGTLTAAREADGICFTASIPRQMKAVKVQANA